MVLRGRVLATDEGFLLLNQTPSAAITRTLPPTGPHIPAIGLDRSLA